MYRFLISAVFLAAAAPAVAGQPGQDYRHEIAPDGTVRIVVPLKDLAMCKLTLAMVLHPVVVDENGNAVGYEPAAADATPPAVCVTDEG